MVNILNTNMYQEDVHIACGYRCSTKFKMTCKKASLPFDSGFFTPSSIRNFLDCEKIVINEQNTCPCIKYGDQKSSEEIKFVESSYEEIDQYIEKYGYSNEHLDSTGGYYTLCKDLGCVFAHYNWHKSSNRAIKVPTENLKILEDTLNRRKARLIDLINNSNTIHIHYFTNYTKVTSVMGVKHILSNDVAEKNLTKTFLRYNKRIVFHGY